MATIRYYIHFVKFHGILSYVVDHDKPFIQSQSEDDREMNLPEIDKKLSLFSIVIYLSAFEEGFNMFLLMPRWCQRADSAPPPGFSPYLLATAEVDAKFFVPYSSSI